MAISPPDMMGFSTNLYDRHGVMGLKSSNVVGLRKTRLTHELLGMFLTQIPVLQLIISPNIPSWTPFPKSFIEASAFIYLFAHLFTLW